MFADIIRSEVAQYGVTFKQLAEAVNVAPCTMSQYIGGSRNMPGSVEAGIIERLQSPRLSEERCSNCQGNMFPTRYLDNIDDHPVVALSKTQEETQEVLDLMSDARKVLINKKKGATFTDAEDALLKSIEDECADLITVAKTFLIKMHEWYNRPVAETMRRHIEKLEQQGYCSKRKAVWQTAK